MIYAPCSRAKTVPGIGAALTIRAFEPFRQLGSYSDVIPTCEAWRLVRPRLVSYDILERVGWNARSGHNRGRKLSGQVRRAWSRRICVTRVQVAWPSIFRMARISAENASIDNREGFLVTRVGPTWNCDDPHPGFAATHRLRWTRA